jgi:hypothetical protein
VLGVIAQSSPVTFFQPPPVPFALVLSTNNLVPASPLAPSAAYKATSKLASCEALSHHQPIAVITAASAGLVNLLTAELLSSTEAVAPGSLVGAVVTKPAFVPIVIAILFCVSYFDKMVYVKSY